MGSNCADCQRDDRQCRGACRGHEQAAVQAGSMQPESGRRRVQPTGFRYCPHCGMPLEGPGQTPPAGESQATPAFCDMSYDIGRSGDSDGSEISGSSGNSRRPFKIDVPNWPDDDADDSDDSDDLRERLGQDWASSSQDCALFVFRVEPSLRLVGVVEGL